MLFESRDAFTIFQCPILLSPLLRLEEETLLHYTASSFYPVHIGQIFHEKYQVKVKLGFGGSSTVWLCQDKKYISTFLRFYSATLLLCI